MSFFSMSSIINKSAVVLTALFKSIILHLIHLNPTVPVKE